MSPPPPLLSILSLHHFSSQWFLLVLVFFETKNVKKKKTSFEGMMRLEKGCRADENVRTQLRYQHSCNGVDFLKICIYIRIMRIRIHFHPKFHSFLFFLLLTNREVVPSSRYTPLSRYVNIFFSMQFQNRFLEGSRIWNCKYSVVCF